MPTPLHAPVLLLSLIWTIFFVQFYQTAHAGRLNTSYSRWLWLAKFLGVMIVTFSGKEIEHFVDHLMGIPITFYVKYLCALMVIHALYFMLRPTMSLSRKMDWVLRYGCVVTLLVGWLTFPLAITLPDLLKEQLRYGLLALRDVVVCIYILVAFIPATYRFWRDETVLPTKFKHFSGLMFDCAYLLLAIGNISTFIVSLNNLETAGRIDLAFKPVLSLCVVFFIGTIIPHRLLAILLWPQRWWLLRRLRRLEARIAQSAETPLDEIRGTGLEGQIYRVVIFILDQYRMLRDDADPQLYYEIDDLVKTHRKYSPLVEHLAKLA